MKKSSELRILIQLDPAGAKRKIEAALTKAGDVEEACLILDVSEQPLRCYCKRLRISVATGNDVGRHEASCGGSARRAKRA